MSFKELGEFLLLLLEPPEVALPLLFEPPEVAGGADQGEATLYIFITYMRQKDLIFQRGFPIYLDLPPIGKKEKNFILTQLW